MTPCDCKLLHMQCKIRKATIKDAGAIASVLVKSWRSTYAGIVPDAYLASMNVEASADRWKKTFKDGNTLIFAAEDQAGLFGFVWGGKLRSPIDDYDGELRAIYLLREHQHKGAGRLLAEALAEALRTDGFTSMVAWVLKENSAVSFYQRLGGVQIAQSFIELGGVQLPELAFGWPALDDLLKFPMNKGRAAS